MCARVRAPKSREIQGVGGIRLERLCMYICLFVCMCVSACVVLLQYRTTRNYKNPEFLGPRVFDKVLISRECGRAHTHTHTHTSTPLALVLLLLVPTRSQSYFSLCSMISHAPPHRAEHTHAHAHMQAPATCKRADACVCVCVCVCVQC